MDRKTLSRVALPIIMLFTMAAAQTGCSDSQSVPNGPLTGEIDYRFVAHLEQRDENDRLLVWEADVAGDIEGTMKWWVVTPPPSGEINYSGGRLNFYAARWELWYEEELLLAGVSAGKVNFRDGADGVWDGHGRVTEATGKYRFLRARSIYETGPVIVGSNPPESIKGTGVFVIF